MAQIIETSALARVATTLSRSMMRPANRAWSASKPQFPAAKGQDSMLRSHRLISVLSWLSSSKARHERRRRFSPQCRLLGDELECLEGRIAPAAFVVTTQADTVAADLSSGQDAAGKVSLRSAVMAANKIGGNNSISLSAGTYHLTNGGLVIGGGSASLSLSINGAGRDATLIDAQTLSLAFEVLPASHATLSGLHIQNGENDTGGAISNAGILAIEDSTLSGNSADNFGGALFNDTGAQMTLTRCLITNNAAGFGGGVANLGTLSLIDSSVLHNSADVAGGGVENDVDAMSTLQNCIVSLNSSSYGGGVANFGDISIADCNLANNQVTNPANPDDGAYGGGLYNSVGSTASVNDSTIRGNAAETDGGGIINYGALTLTESTLSTNSAVSGAGIANAGGQLTVYMSTLSDNSATTPVTDGVNAGGGIYNAPVSGGFVSIINSTLFANKAASGGGAVANLASLTMSNSTLSKNTAPVGGGLGGFAGQLVVRNSLVAGNTASARGPDVFGAIPTGNNNLVGNGSDMTGISNSDSQGNRVGTSANPIDPRLGDLGANGGSTETVMLLPGSPALGAGGAVTTVGQTTTSDMTGFAVADASAVACTPGHYLLMVHGEEMEVTSVNVQTNVLTVTRAVNGIHAPTLMAGEPIYFFSDQRRNPVGPSHDVGAYTPVTRTSLIANPLATTGGKLVKLTATVSPFGTTAGTVAFLDNGIALPGGNAVPVSGGTAVFSTSTLSAGSHPMTAVFQGAPGFSPSTSNTQNVDIVVIAPSVANVSFNAGLAGFSTAQHSRVINVQVTFNQAVSVDANAFVLSLHTKGVSLGGMLFPDGFGAIPALIVTPSTDRVAWTISFTGEHTEVGNSDLLASLSDGVYDLTIDAAKVHPFQQPGVNGARTITTTFFRLFGDTDDPQMTVGGDNSVAWSAVVNTGDNFQFRSSFNRPAPDYRAWLDFDGDGIINTGDNFEFRKRFNKTLTWQT
jgi:hypothetical protein